MQRSKGRLEIPPWIGIIIFAVIVVVMAPPATQSHTSTPVAQRRMTEPSVQEDAADPARMMKRIRLLARQSHGDWYRLPATDRQLIDSVTGGHGRSMLRMMAEKEWVGGHMPESSKKTESYKN